jgi:O-antigen/teichoic acid export membrane protein
MRKQLIFTNAIMSSIQIALVSIVVFLLYKFLLNVIGIEQLGIWSLILSSTTVVAQAASFGMTGSVVKFVAKYIARGEEKIASLVIQTAVISFGIITGCLLLISYPLVKWILSFIVPAKSIKIAFSILPFAFFSLWFMTITSVFNSVLDGLQKVYLRNILMISYSLFYAFLCFLFSPKYGLIGLAYAQVISNFVFLVLSLILVKICFPIFPFLPYKWDKNLFKEIINYGLNFQIISITAMFYDPITKALISKFGGLSMVGYYEMANKMVQHIRALIISANQSLVPVIANLYEKRAEKVNTVYLTNYRLLFFISLPLFTLIIIILPLISVLWIGRYEKIFITLGTLITLGWFLNILDAPSYFANLGTGNLRWNVIGHIITGILNIVLGIIFGFIFDGYGVVVGWVIALSVGSATIYISYHITNGISLKELFPKDSRSMAYLCIILTLFSFTIHLFSGIQEITTITLIIIISGLLLIFPQIYNHPIKNSLIIWAKELFNKGLL